MKKIGLIIILILSLNADNTVVDKLFKKCTVCHGINAEKKALEKSLIIADLNTTELVTMLLGYKNKTYGRTMKGIMYGQVNDLNKTQILDLATYIPTLKK